MKNFLPGLSLGYAVLRDSITSNRKTKKTRKYSKTTEYIIFYSYERPLYYQRDTCILYMKISVPLGFKLIQYV